MEQVLAPIKERIPEFAGYDDEVTRRLADEQIRGVVGEALALLHDRHAEYFSEEATRLYDSLLLRCEFMNQQAFKDFEYARLDDARKQAIGQADQELVREAAQAQGATPETLERYLRDLSAAFDRRDHALTNT